MGLVLGWLASPCRRYTTFAHAILCWCVLQGLALFRSIVYKEVLGSCSVPDLLVFVCILSHYYSSVYTLFQFYISQLATGRFLRFILLFVLYAKSHIFELNIPTYFHSNHSQDAVHSIRSPCSRPRRQRSQPAQAMGQRQRQPLGSVGSGPGRPGRLF
jgi:hypothetical protein